MRNLTTFSIVLAGFVLTAGVAPAFADDARKNSVRRLEDRISEINRATEKPEKMRVAMDKISTETGVPSERVHSMHKEHSNAGAGGIMLACVLADETKKSPGHFLERHDSGKSWPAIADDNNIPIDRLTGRLDRLQWALDEGKKPK